MSSGCTGDFSSYSDCMFSYLSSIDVFVLDYKLLSEGLSQHKAKLIYKNSTAIY